MVRRQLSSEVRKKVNTLIITDVHARDIIESFVRDSIMDASEFAWESQLRFYWDADADDLLIRQCTGGSWPVFLTNDQARMPCSLVASSRSSCLPAGQFSYGFEYMGLNGRLVITSLTDR